MKIESIYIKYIKQNIMTDIGNLYINSLIAQYPQTAAWPGLRAIHPVLWHQWQSGAGRYLHAEYIMSCAVLSEAGQFDIFKWDRAKLRRVVNRIDWRNHVEFESHIVGNFMIKTKNYALQITTPDYAQVSFIKYDYVANVMIKLVIETSLVPNHYRDSPYIEIEHTSKTIRNGDLIVTICGTMYCFAIREHVWRGAVNHNTETTWVRVCNHNLREIMKFMLSSRLNLVDYLPKYEYCDS